MSDSEMQKKIENSSIDDSRNIVIDSLPSQCKSVGKSFFSCVESRLLQLSSNSGLSYKEMEDEMTNKYVPECMSKFNLEECLTKYDPSI